MFNQYLTQNPDLTTRLKIALERMYEEKKELEEEERREEIMHERKQLAMAVCEAAYNRIRMAIRGELSVPLTPGNKEQQGKKMINLGDEIEVSDNDMESHGNKLLKKRSIKQRIDPITRFRSGLE